MFEAFENKSLLTGTDYFELLDGKFKNKCWNDNSLFISEFDFSVIEDVFSEANKGYDHFSFVEYDNSEIRSAIEGLKKRISEVENLDFTISGEIFSNDYYERLNECIGNDRKNVQIFIAKIIKWMEKLKNDEMTLLGM